MKTRCHPVWMHFQLQQSATDSNKATEEQNLTNLQNQLSIINIWGFCSVEPYLSFSTLRFRDTEYKKEF